jgi:hypothetical protein
LFTWPVILYPPTFFFGSPAGRTELPPKNWTGQ